MLQALQVSQPIGWALVAGQCPMVNVDSTNVGQFEKLVGKDIAVYGGRFDAKDNAMLESHKVNTPASLTSHIDKVVGIVQVKDILKSSQSRWFTGTYGITFKNPRMYPTPVDIFDDPEDAVVFKWDTPPVISIPHHIPPSLCDVCNTEVYAHGGHVLSPAGFLHKSVCDVLRDMNRQQHSQFLSTVLDGYVDSKKAEVIQGIAEAIAELRTARKNQNYFAGYSNSFGLTSRSSRELLLAHLVSIKGFTYMKSLDISHWSVLEQAADLVRRQTGIKVQFDPQEIAMTKFLQDEKIRKAQAAQRLKEKQAARK